MWHARIKKRKVGLNFKKKQPKPLHDYFLEGREENTARSVCPHEGFFNNLELAGGPALSQRNTACSIPGQNPAEENVLPWRVLASLHCFAAGGQCYWSKDMVVPGLWKKYCLGGLFKLWRKAPMNLLHGAGVKIIKTLALFPHGFDFSVCSL